MHTKEELLHLRQMLPFLNGRYICYATMIIKKISEITVKLQCFKK